MDNNGTHRVEKNDQRGTQTFLTCAYGAALLQQIYLNDEGGHVESLRLKGETMDAICKAWQEYRASQKSEASHG